MHPAPLPHNEQARLERLKALGVLDTAPEPIFDSFTRIASQVCGAPMALFSLVDEERQWFKSSFGIALGETPRELAFCAHAILADPVMEVPDATRDARFAGNPLVTGEPGIRFYAGAPIILPGGERIGTLCVLDRKPRQLEPAQRRLLIELSGALAHALLMRERMASMVTRDIGALKAVERAVREGERKFRILSDESPVGVFHADADGHCTYTNQRWQEIFGMSLAQSLGDNWGQTLHPDDRAAVQEVWACAAGAASDFAMDFRVVRPDGTLRQVRARARPIPGDDGEVTSYVGAVEDITDQLLAERRLRASEALLDRTGRMAGVGGWELDLRTHEVTWSAQTCRIHDLEPGHQPTLAEGLSYYTRESRPLIARAVQEAISNATAWDLELPFVTARGRPIWVRSLGEVDFEDGRAVRLVGAFQDITARRLAEDSLQESRQLLRVLYEATPAMLHSIDADGRLQTVTDIWLETLGYGRDEVIGRLLTDFLTDDSRHWLVHHTRKELFRVGSMRKVPFQMVRRDGDIRDVLTSAVVDLDLHGEPRRTLVYLDDITDDLARKAELEREQALRRQIERHAADLDRLLIERTDMLDVLAHEVRQPLNNASAALQSVASELADKGAVAASARLERAQRVMGEVLAGVDNTLAAATLLARADTLERQDTDIDMLIGVTVADMPMTARARVIVERATSTRTVTVDMSLMRLALRNLLANALRYSPVDTPVNLRIADSDEPLALMLEVSDRGGGIAPAVLARLFERGARGSGGGHGLGLYIVKRVMDLHGGRVDLLRNTPSGCTFRLVIEQSTG